MSGCLAVILGGSYPVVAAEDIKDPLYRDESIAGVEITVDVRRLPSGNWEYLYDITSPDTNKGTVIEFRLDLSECVNADELAEQYELVEPPPDPPAMDFHGYAQSPREFPPTYLYSVYGKTSPGRFARSSDAAWFMQLKPGQSIEDLKIVSVAGPQQRAYRFLPSWSSGDWDYGKYFGTQTELPRQNDFAVEGTVIGPGCTREANE